MCLLIVRLEIEVNKPKRGGSLLKLDLVKTARQELALSYRYSVYAVVRCQLL